MPVRAEGRVLGDSRCLHYMGGVKSTLQAAEFVIGPHGTDIWWPQLDEVQTLPNMLEGRTGTDKWMERLHRRGVAA